MAIVGANPKDDGPSMVAFHETGLAEGVRTACISSVSTANIGSISLQIRNYI